MSTSANLFSDGLTKDQRIAALEGLLGQEREKLKNYESQISWLNEQLKSLERSKFGKKSERWETQEQVVMVFNEAEVEAQKPEPPDEEELATPVAAHTRKARGHRKALPENLPREIVKVELPESEQVTESGEKLKVIGWEISEKLKYEPAKVTVLRYERAKYGVESGDYIKTAPPVPSVIPKGIATPELLAAIVTGKYADGLPLYRIEEILQRQGIELSRTTMARWMVQISNALIPIRNVLSEKLFSAYAIACDETAMQVLKEPGRDAGTKSWMIVRTTPTEAKRVVLFDYSTSRSGKTFKDLMAGYEGRLLCDGLESYSAVESEKVIRFGCHMHARRKFEQAAKDGAKSGQGLAARVMNLYKKLYDHEEEIVSASFEEKVRLRDKVQKPMLEEIKSLAEAQRAKVPSKSKLGQAFTYYLNEYKYLMRYLDDGKMAPDNGFIERTIRKFAIGRNAWLFADTPEGAEASALLYSLAITAKLNAVNPYTALTQMLAELPTAKTLEDYERLAEFILTPHSPAQQ